MSAQSEPQTIVETSTDKKKRFNYKKLYQSPDYFFDIDTSVSPFGKRAGLDAFNSVGLFTYLRTYARRLEQDNAKSLVESWEQCIKRVVLATNDQLHVGFKHEELKELFDILYNLKCSVAGRFLWQLGTKTVEQSGLTSLQNCFRRDTQFWTPTGLRRFSECKVGEQVKVMTSASWRIATVKSYGEQELYRLFLRRNNDTYYIDCTLNHRWIIQGTNKVKTTEDLVNGDLLRAVNCALWTVAYGWSVEAVKPLNLTEEVWCVEVPELEEFVLGNGILTKNCAATVVDEPIEPFTWSMNMQMLGCVPPESMVATETGLKMIKDIDIGEKVWSFDTTTGKNVLKEVLETHDVIVEKSENIRLTGHYGNITVSKEHPILVFRDKEWKFIPSNQVKLGDVLNKLSIQDEEKLRWDMEAWFVGAFLGDGTSDIVKNSRRIRFLKDKECVVSTFADVLGKLLNNDVQYELSKRKDYNVKVWEVAKTFSNKETLYKKWSSLIGNLPSNKTKSICIPDWIKTRWDKNIFMSFLIGLIDTDGNVSNDHKIHYSTSSYKMVEDLKHYCPLYGIYPWVHEQTHESYTYSGYKPTSTLYRVSFSINYFTKYTHFFQCIPKRERISDYISRSYYTNQKLIIPDELVDTETEYLNLPPGDKYHFKKKLEKTGYCASQYYIKHKKSFQHILAYDRVIDIEDNLDIDKHWKDLTIQDTNNYFTGEGSQYCSHNCGVGYRITPEDVDNLPIVKYAEIVRQDSKDADYIVPDSREGWVKLLGKVLKAHFYSGKGFSYSCALLRSKGAPIKGFGGVASGPDILCEGMAKISDLLNSKEGRKLKPVDALDIMNIIGMIVVSGNVRRSAQIALGDFKDIEYLRAKRWDLGNIPNSRCYSNNSIICNDINEILDNEEFWDGYQGKGEPYGLINMRLTQSCGRTGETQYPDRDVVCYNPCSEQSLNNGEVCCLAELYLPNITSKEELFKCSKYLYRICKHSLTLPCRDSEKTEKVVHKNMRMGIGVTGFCQATEEQKSWLPECYEFLRNYDLSYSQRHKLPTSIKLTTCKPSGTLSLLAGVTSGVHPGYAKYYIRRIRLSSDSPLVDLARRHGYFVEYVRNFDGTMDRTTMVIEFPYELPEHTVLAKNCNAIEQLENMKWVQKNWSDNSVSITVYYQRDELPAIKEWLRENYNDNVKTVSFLLHSEHGFDQAPLEEITKERYDEMVRNTRPIDSVEGVCYHKEKDENLTDKSLCVGGVCPIR